MEKRSRLNKYRDLRESLKEDASLPKQTIQEESKTNDSQEDFIPTLHEYRMKQIMDETKELANELDGVEEELDNKEIEEALHRVRLNSGKGQQYNTRLDILNHIQATNVETIDEQPLVEPDENFYVEEEKTVEIPVVKETVEPKEHLEETKVLTSKQQEQINEELERVEHPRFFYDNQEKEQDQEEDDEDEDEEENGESTSVLMKVLTGIIVVLSICLVILLIYIIKIFLF